MLKNAQAESNMKLPISSNKFNKYELYKFRHATMAIVENIGFSTSNSSAVSSLSFLLRTYFEQLCRDSLNSAINSGRAEVGLEDVSYVFGANGINITELHDYIQQVQPYAADEHPLFPVTEPLNVPPPSSEIADTSEQKNGERESAGNDGAEVDEEGNREQNNKHSLNSFNSRSNVRNAISQKIFPNFVGAFAPNLGFSVRKVELPTENVSVDQHLFTILLPPESAQHVIFEFDRSVAQPMRARAAISEEQERLLKKEKKKKKREKEKRMAEKSEQIQLSDGKRKNHKPKDHPTESTDTPSIVSVSEDKQQNPSADTVNESSKMDKRILIRIPISQRTPPPVTTTNTTPIVPVSEDKQQNPAADTESPKIEKRILIRIPISQRTTSPPVTTTTNTTPIANTTTIVSVSEDKRNSPAPLTVTSSGRSVKPSKRKFEETEPKKPMSTKGQTKTTTPKAAKIAAPHETTTPSFSANDRSNNSAEKVKAEEKTEPKKPMATKGHKNATPKAAKVTAPQKVTTPSFPANDRSNNSAEKVKAIAKAVEQIAAAHFSGTQSTKKIPAQNAVASNDGEEEEEDIWICPTCSVAYVEGQEMVACDDCDRWYHWGCVGILIPPPEKAQWYCTECRRKRKKAAQRQQTSTGGGSGSNSRKSSFSGGTPTGGTAPAKKQRIAKA